MLGLRFWELHNFDVDRSFVKVDHERYVRDEMVLAIKELIEDHNADVFVVGEASTTNRRRHNSALSLHRAACVRTMLIRELRRVGVTDTSHVLPPLGLGDALSRIRQLGQETEAEADRKVTVVAVRHDRYCSEAVRTRRSDIFRVKAACASPISAAINIGDISDPLQPTFRRFIWVHGPSAEGCRFIVGRSEQIAASLSDMRLAVRDGANPSARSDFQGDAVLDAATTVLMLARLHFLPHLQGTWDPLQCANTSGDIDGVLMPVGPVECGDVPDPPSVDCSTTEGDCSDRERMAASTKFAALMVRVGYGRDASGLRYVGWILDLLGIVPQVGGAVVLVGTVDGPEPPILRAFAFGGAGIHGPTGLDKQVGVAGEATSARPLRLATRDPQDLLSASDFDSEPRSLGELVIHGAHSSAEELRVGGITFGLSGLFCNHGASRSVYGEFHGISPVWCFDIRRLTFHEPQPDCNEECPEERQLARHTLFTFRVGRAALNSLPVIGKRLADMYGCEIVAAYLNIGAEPDEANERIYRPFLFVAARADCRFDVGRRTWIEPFFVPRRLSVEDPDDRFDLSDFAGGAWLNETGIMRVLPFAVATPYQFRLPGSYASCPGAKRASGLLVPLDEVLCGATPEPLHSTDPDLTDLDRCASYGTSRPAISSAVDRLRSGDFDPWIDLVVNPPGLVYPEIEALPGHQGEIIDDALFVGRSGIPGHPRVVTFADIEVAGHGHDSNTGRLWVDIRIVSAPCSFDENGHSVFVQPINCVETLPLRGTSRRLFSLPVHLRRPGQPRHAAHTRTATRGTRSFELDIPG